MNITEDDMTFKKGQRVIRRGTVTCEHGNLLTVVWDGDDEDDGRIYNENEISPEEPVIDCHALKPSVEGTADNDVRWQALQSDLKREILEEVAVAWDLRDGSQGDFSHILRERAKRMK